MRFQYKDVCEHPQDILDQVRNRAKKQWDYDLQQITTFSEGFPYRTYEDRDHEKDEFRKIIQSFEKKENEPLFDFPNL